MLRSIAVAVLATLATVPAHADLARLSATYDPFLQNTVFTVTNDATVAETIALTTSFGTPSLVTLAPLAGGASETYSFSQVMGGFINDPASAGIPDSTTYMLLVGLNGATPGLASAAFSPLSNMTGTDVDFLGNQCQGFGGGACGTTIALSGTVTAVPEPASLALLLCGLAGLGLAAKRRRA